MGGPEYYISLGRELNLTPPPSVELNLSRLKAKRKKGKYFLEISLNFRYCKRPNERIITRSLTAVIRQTDFVGPTGLTNHL